MENLLLVSSSGSSKINIRSIEEFIEKNFLLTYEIKSQEKITLGYADYSVLMIAANSCYPQLTGKKMTEGSFFFGQAWTGSLKHAVLNEKAAFEIFGSFNIAGKQFKIKNDTWIVTGVINDGNKETSVIYAPSSSYNAASGNSVSEFLALISPSLGLDETYVKNSLKSLGVHENNFNFYNLGSQINLMFERPQIILLLFFTIFLLFLFAFFKGKFKDSIAVLKNDLEKKYAHELIKEKRGTLIKPVFIILFLVCCPSFALFLLIRAASIILPWQDISLLNDCKELFFPHIERLYHFEFASRLIFIFSLVLLFLMIIMLFFTKKTLKKPETMPQ